MTLVNGTTVLAKLLAAVLTTRRSCRLVYIGWREVVPNATIEKVDVCGISPVARTSQCPGADGANLS